jgi:Carboxypeptidase regulatory-like domain
MRGVTRALFIVLVLVLLGLIPTPPAGAQIATAELNGRVTDESGAVLPGATVTVTQTATGLVRTVVTESNGTYLLSNLPTGPYRLEVMLQGFRTYVQTGIVLQVGATPTINAVLALGALEESITVEGAAPLVDVRSAGISNVIENQRILELPLNGRNSVDLVLSVGAAVQTGTVSARGFPGEVNISVAGGLSTGVGYTLDGAAHNNPQQNTNLPLPFPDALQEFRVATSGLSAQNGVHSGAAVNAITKSGSNRFSGDAFEFLRDHRFNAISPFAAVGPDGKKLDDGLKRNQFGGTLGGPIVKNKLFFFAAYQGTTRRQRPTSNIEFVPTAAMLAGDFTQFASPACNGGRQITLKAPFVNNTVSPSQFSPAAMNVAKRLPTTTDPCGLINFGVAANQDQRQPLVRVDYQLSTKHAFFGRYMATQVLQPPGYAGGSDNLLKTDFPGLKDMIHSFTAGETTVFSAAVVNAVRFAVNKSKVNTYQTPFFSPRDIGVNLYSYLPGYMPINVTGGFRLYQGTNTFAIFLNDTYQGADDLTIVKGTHQLGFGGNVQYWTGDYTSSSRASGNWIFDGSTTGLGLADFLTGRLTSVEHGGLGKLPVDNWYVGLYGQDSWRVSSRVTLNYGMRWEPYFGQNVRNGVISVFNMDNFTKNVQSKVFLKAPAGVLYAGDTGFPNNKKTGMNKQWWNLSPRGGFAWDVHGDGRLAVRSSYAMAYDFMAGEYHNIDANAPPFGNRSFLTSVPFDDPYQGHDPHPVVTNANTDYVPFGTFGTMDPGINSPRVQSWNASVEKQMGANWSLSVAYLGSHSDRLWAQKALNPAIYMGLGPCTIQGVSYTVCSTTANTNQRRVLNTVNPAAAAFIGALDENTDIGYQNYKGVKLSAVRRAGSGLTVNGTYTLGVCRGTPTATTFNQASGGYLKPNDPSFDDGYCDQDYRHIASATLGYETPAVGTRAVRTIVSHWRASGILSARSGDRLNITTGRDIALTGIGVTGNNQQRPNQVSTDYYKKTLTNWFNAAAFAQPDPGTLGNLKRNAVVGPAFWNIDLALSRLIPLGASRRMELRLESFNLLNHFNWGNPLTNFNAGTFGRITTQAGAPRIMQFGIKYDF